MVPTADIVYWTFQKHVSWYSNSQSTVHITGDNYCPLLPHKTLSVCCTFGEHRAVNSCVPCIWQTAVHWASWPSFHLHIARRCSNLSTFLQSVFCPVELLAVFVLTSRTAKKSTIRCGLVYKFAKCTECSLVCLSSPNTQHTILHAVAIFEISDI